MALLRAFLLAATAYLKVLPLLHLRSLYQDLDNYDDEIFTLAASGTAADELRMELLAKRKGRVDKQIRAIRSSSSDADKG